MKRLRMILAAACCLMVTMVYAVCSPVNSTYLVSGFGDCTVDNSTIWTWDSYNYAKATAYQTGLEPSEVHLFTPESDLSGAKTVTLSFSHIHRYCATPSEELTLWVTDNYKGSFAATSWYELQISPYADQTAWKPWIDVTINVPVEYVGSKTVFAFKYKWTDSSKGTWELKNVNLQSECANGSTASPVSLPNIGDGRLRIYAQNLRNYYFNLNSGRGNYTEAEFKEKTRKIVDAMMWGDADIYALCEVEAQPIVLEQLADSMNTRVEGEPFVAVYDGIAETWSADKDYNIKSGFIYNTNTVETVGSSVGGTGGNGYYAHTMRIQTFEEKATGERFTLSMNHFKAKDNSEDKGEAQRKTNATNLVTRLPQYALDPDILILGDLNCEIGEEPLEIIKNAGYEEQLLKYNSSAYSHCYNGGELIDHAFANASMAAYITGAGVYHICTSCGSDASYNYNYRYSDHDAYIVAINLPEKQEGECEDLAEILIPTGGTGLSPMSAESLSGTYTWMYSGTYGANCQDLGGEDWLITPTYDLSQSTNIQLAFEHTIGYANVENMKNEQTLWVTPDYSTVAGSQWTQLTIPTYPAGNNWTYVSANVSVPENLVGANTAFAFKYMVPAEAANKPKWEIKNLHITATCKGSGTGWQDTELEQRAQKTIENGQLIITLPDGSMYNGFGIRIR